LLPTIPTPQDAPTFEADQAEEPWAAGGSVLLTEDHRQVREIMTETLEDGGYAVTQATTGFELLDVLAAKPDGFDALIVDLDIPGPDGIECLQRLRADGVRTPAVLVTGTGASDIEDRVGYATSVLRKPFPMVELRRVVAELIDGAVTERTRG
jgi:CheY-like chemotaxis protein